MKDDPILSIRQAAAYLGVSYHTIFHKRHALGFQLPGGRKWYIKRSAIDNLSKKENNVLRLSLQVDKPENVLCRSTKEVTQTYGGSISEEQRAKELDALLAPRTKNKQSSS